jgi:hypothetical protein
VNETEREELRNQHKPCPWASCQCTHTGICTGGWIDVRRPDGSDFTQPCPTCRPEVSAHLRARGKSLRRLRSELPGLPRPSRHGNANGQW